MTHHVKPIPDGYHTATPALIVDDAVKALEFYSKAFRATERMRSAGLGGGKITHAEFQIGDSIFMLADEIPEMGSRSPKHFEGSPGGVWLYVPDVDATYGAAMAAGARSLSAPMDMFWGDRHARIRDPFGHEWSIATHTEDVAPAELQNRANAFYAQMTKRARPNRD
ncbi:MAG: VOC family protein [Thermoplasmata archaeon]